MILLSFGIVSYIIIDEVTDRKIENCMWNHFHRTGLLSQYRYEATNNPTTAKYSALECQSIVDENRGKTIRVIDGEDFNDCLKQEFKAKYLDDIMLSNFLKQHNRDSLAINYFIIPKIMKECNVLF